MRRGGLDGKVKNFLFECDGKDDASDQSKRQQEKFRQISKHFGNLSTDRTFLKTDGQKLCLLGQQHKSFKFFRL